MSIFMTRLVCPFSITSSFPLIVVIRCSHSTNELTPKILTVGLPGARASTYGKMGLNFHDLLACTTPASHAKRQGCCAHISTGEWKPPKYSKRVAFLAKLTAGGVPETSVLCQPLSAGHDEKVPRRAKNTERRCPLGELNLDAAAGN